MGAPDWVSSPITASYNIASHSGPADMEEDTEAFVQGIAMSKKEEFNSHPKHVAASLSAPPLQAFTWPMLESACQV